MSATHNRFGTAVLNCRWTRSAGRCEGASALFQVVSQRYLKSSIVLTTNRPVGSWGEILGDTTVAAALSDRLLHRCVVLTLDGASYRLRDHHAAADILRRATQGTTDEPTSANTTTRTNPTQRTPGRHHEYPARPTGSSQHLAVRAVAVSMPRQIRLPRTRHRRDQRQPARVHRRANSTCSTGSSRHANTVGNYLADYLHATGCDQPRNRAGYDANLLIDQVSFTAHALRAHRQQPLK